MIKVNNISFAYDGKQVLDGFSYTFADNTLTVIKGESGIGKTTLLNIISGIIKPDEGDVNMSGSLRMVFQEDRLLEWKTATENITVTGTSTEKAHEMLNLLGLSDEKDKYPDEMSGGQRQRVAIARALVANRDNILMDEPFSSLDTDTAKSVCDVIKRLTKGKTLIVVTHNDIIIDYLCDESNVLYF